MITIYVIGSEADRTRASEVEKCEGVVQMEIIRRPQDVEDSASTECDCYFPHCPPYNTGCIPEVFG